MSEKKRIVSFDLDLTLFDHTLRKITPSAMEAIKRLREDYYIVIASGRDMGLTSNKWFTEQIKPDAIIHANGAKVTKGRKILRDLYYPRELTRQVIEAIKKEQWCIGAHFGDYAYFVNPEAAAVMYKQWWGTCTRKFRPVDELLDKKIYTMLTNEPKQNMDIFEARFPDLRAMWFGGIQGADIVRREASKKQGMEALLEYWGLTFMDVIAFGDSFNDAELLKYAEVGVAMGNGDEIAKREADLVTDAIDKDGVWNACKFLGII